MKKLMLSLGVVSALALGFTSCNDDDNGSSTSLLNANFQGLEALGEGYVYEGWLIVDGSPVSTGTFTNVNDAQSFAVNATILQSATEFVLSIEPAGETGVDAATPSNTKVLSGAFGDTGAAALTVNAQIGDFSNAAGSFFLRTPTDETGTNNGNDENGVWFGVPGMPPMADFSLPNLPAGWAYEGWVVTENGPVSTGVFTAFNERDSFSDFSGTSQQGPLLPGEDFFNNAPAGQTFPLDVRGKTVVVSVEPVPDDSAAPFALKPLVAEAGQDTAPASYALNRNLNSLPTGLVAR